MSGGHPYYDTQHEDYDDAGQPLRMPQVGAHSPTHYDEPLYDPPPPEPRPLSAASRTQSYAGGGRGGALGSPHDDDSEDYPMHNYPSQQYQMPQWADDDLYRMGTPSSQYHYDAPPPPPKPYVPGIDDDGDDDGNEHVYPPAQGYSSYTPQQEYGGYGPGEDDDRRPILQHQDSTATFQSVDKPQNYPSAAAAAEGKEEPAKNWADVKTVTLKSGNLVLNCPLPDKLMEKLPKKAPLEFSCMRYSAATCDPKEFTENKFALRQQLFGQPRQTELFIVITMYAEEENLFGRTMEGVLANIEYMCTKAKDECWKENGWKKIVVCVVSDGRTKINPKTRSLLAAMGCYQEGIAKYKVNGEAVQAHIYEHTTQVGIKVDKAGKVTVLPGGLAVPVQVLFCLKENNQQKINSHRWFFQAFGPALEPNICVLLDAGTKPGKDSIYHLWKAFYQNPQCAGACGEIKAMLSEGGGILNPLVATQNFEYKMSNILDKPLESVFGFISVLPGAFSAYRYDALQNDVKGEGPLNMYFKGEEMHAGTVDAGILTKNMYLAEDRILCFELVTKRKSHWTLQYVKSAYAETDVPDNLVELVKQRRRWLNGSFFAAIFALVHTKDIWRSDHSFTRKFAFLIEFFYQTISLIFSWFALANFFLVFRILTASLGEPAMHFAPGGVMSVIFEWIYFGCLFTCFILALGNKPEGSRKMYFSMVIIWAVIMLYLMFAAIFITVKSIQAELRKNKGKLTAGGVFSNAIFRDLCISLASTYILYFVASFMYLEPWHMFTSFVQYIFLSPSYINVLNIYAFCNVHDISWGTKGVGAASHSAKDEVSTSGKIAVQAAKDRNQNYESELANLSAAGPPIEKPKTEAQIKADRDQKDTYYYADVRCWVVLAWCSTNFALVAVILNSGGLNRLVSEDPEEVQNSRSTIYMAVVLWSVAVLSLVRFLGASWFLILRMFRGV